uniref:Uncharacterized protein n=1 Tax=Anguilla anguilla TaxID=7936 RepID=A0A0E9UJI2_ANGAN
MEPAITTEPKSWEPFYFIFIFTSLHFTSFCFCYVKLNSFHGPFLRRATTLNE